MAQNIYSIECHSSMPTFYVLFTYIPCSRNCVVPDAYSATHKIHVRKLKESQRRSPPPATDVSYLLFALTLSAACYSFRCVPMCFVKSKTYMWTHHLFSWMYGIHGGSNDGGDGIETILRIKYIALNLKHHRQKPCMLVSSPNPFNRIIVFTFCVACESTLYLRNSTFSITRTHEYTSSYEYSICSHNLSIFHNPQSQWRVVLAMVSFCLHTYSQIFRSFRVLNLL